MGPDFRTTSIKKLVEGLIFSGLSYTMYVHLAATFVVTTSSVGRWASSVFLKAAEYCLLANHIFNVIMILMKFAA